MKYAQPTLPSQALRFGIATLFCSAVAAAFMLFIAVASLPTNPLSPSWSPPMQAALAQLLPEKWGFFTKSQRDDYFEVYSRENGSWVYTFDGPQSAPKNFFGFLRTARAQGIEIGAIENKLTSKQYRTCDDDFSACTQNIRIIATTENGFADPLLCGDTLIVLRPPVPWSWASFSHVTLSARYARVNVRCK